MMNKWKDYLTDVQAQLSDEQKLAVENDVNEINQHMAKILGESHNVWSLLDVIQNKLEQCFKHDQNDKTTDVTMFVNAPDENCFFDDFGDEMEEKSYELDGHFPITINFSAGDDQIVFNMIVNGAVSLSEPSEPSNYLSDFVDDFVLNDGVNPEFNSMIIYKADGKQCNIPFYMLNNTTLWNTLCEQHFNQIIAENVQNINAIDSIELNFEVAQVSKQLLITQQP